MVDPPVGLVPLDVFIAIFERGDPENDEEGEDDEAWRDGGEFVEKLKDGNGEEEACKET